MRTDTAYHLTETITFAPVLTFHDATQPSVVSADAAGSLKVTGLEGSCCSSLVRTGNLWPAAQRGSGRQTRYAQIEKEC